MPRKSTGCAMCRKRKVKCDEARPHCRRCTNYGTVCPGYRQQDVQFIPHSSRSLDESGTGHFGDNDAIVDPSNQQISSNNHRWRPSRSVSNSSKAGATGRPSGRYVRRNELFAALLGFYLPKQHELSAISSLFYTSDRPGPDAIASLKLAAIEAWNAVDAFSIDHPDTKHRNRSQSLPVREPTGHGRPTRRQKDRLLGAMATVALCRISTDMAKIHESTSRRESQLTSGSTGTTTAGNGNSVQYDSKERQDACLGWCILHNVRHLSIAMGLIGRKNLVFADPTALRATEGASKEDPLVALHDVAVLVPGVLERLDNASVAAAAGRPSDILEVCRELCRLRKALNDWLLWRQFVLGRESYSAVNLSAMSAFISRCSDTAFATAYRFEDAQACAQYQLFWSLCLAIDFSLLQQVSWRLQTAHSISLQQLSEVNDRSEQQIGHDAYASATDFCRSVAYSFESDSALIDHPRNLLLTHIQDFFHQCSYSVEEEWCETVRSALDSPVPPDNTAQTISSSASAAKLIDSQFSDLYSSSPPLAKSHRAVLSRTTDGNNNIDGRSRERTTSRNSSQQRHDSNQTISSVGSISSSINTWTGEDVSSLDFDDLSNGWQVPLYQHHRAQGGDLHLGESMSLPLQNAPMLLSNDFQHAAGRVHADANPHGHPHPQDLISGPARSLPGHHDLLPIWSSGHANESDGFQLFNVPMSYDPVDSHISVVNEL